MNCSSVTRRLQSYVFKILTMKTNRLLNQKASQVANRFRSNNQARWKARQHALTSLPGCAAYAATNPARKDLRRTSFANEFCQRVLHPQNNWEPCPGGNGFPQSKDQCLRHLWRRIDCHFESQKRWVAKTLNYAITCNSFKWSREAHEQTAGPAEELPNRSLRQGRKTLGRLPDQIPS